MSVVKSINDFPWKERKLLVACSGGVDSMVLLHALLNAGHKPEVLHVNYQLRGEDSALDEKLVRETAEKNGLIFHLHRCPTNVTKAKGVNLQAAARDFRRAIFNEWKAQSPEYAIVLAHHADDQTETFFLQLFRGSGTFGLGAMHPDKDQLLRPFLTIPKEEIIHYAIENKVVWREDSSNFQNVYLRNFFRNELLPELKKNNSQLDEAVNVLSSAFRAQQEFLKKQAASLADSWLRSGKLAVELWSESEPDEKLALLKNMQLPLWLMPRLDELASLPNGKSVEAENYTIRKDGHGFELHDIRATETWDFKVEEIEFLPDNFSNDVFYANGDLVDTALLRLEPFKPGERIKSLGIKGSQLISKVMKDAKIPEIKRRSFPVLKYKDEVIWIPNLRTGRNYAASQNTSRLLKITLYRVK